MQEGAANLAKRRYHALTLIDRESKLVCHALAL